MARKGNPARLVVALSVAAALAVFLLSTVIAGQAKASLSPSELGGRTTEVQLAGMVVGPVTGDASQTPLRFRLRDIEGGDPTTVRVSYTGTVSDQFRVGRHVVLNGQLRDGVFVGVKDSLITKGPSKYTSDPKTESR
ncbi:MAG: cytochrome c maturation protein CcmE [Thermoleophilia bacterium]|nr:cytochrome c maturation protein CcmE [Thermoleophilia bacterium]